ncbi:MAG TPA: proprotein convertase P-domain-containing protein [bacterium]|nr:proprotein convertase P-domain-containing protein [bacterium]
MTGTWVLHLVNEAYGNNGSISGWTLYVNEFESPTPTPIPSPTPSGAGGEGTVFGGAFAWERGGWYTSRVNIPVRGIVTDINLGIDAQCNSTLIYTGLYLFSPEGQHAAMYRVGDLTGRSFYKTLFNDEAPQAITGGVEPYTGDYRPVENLTAFDGEWLTGTWTLVFYNNNDENGGRVTDWKIEYAYLVPPTPTPSATPTRTPVPSATPTTTPVGYKTPIPTRSPSPTPTPTPLERCVLYAGLPTDIYQQDIELTGVTATDPRRVDRVLVAINQLSTENESALKNVGIYLYSPAGKVVALFEVDELSGAALSGTWFDDDASSPITDGVAPYPGYWQPAGNLSDFESETIAGTWSLLVYNSTSGCVTTCPVHLSDWSILICAAATPTPFKPTPIPTPGNCLQYDGSSFDLPGGQVSESTITITQEGKIRGLTMELEAQVTNDLGEVSAYLISPSGTSLTLFNPGALSGCCLYETRLDDSAGLLMAAGSSPYLGTFRPAQAFANLAGEFAPGDWVLAVLNSTSGGGGSITDWSLTLCWAPPTPTPTPQPTPTPELGLPESILIQSGDYDGDGTSDIAVFRASAGLWAVRGVGTDFLGQAGDIPVSGDYDGDGTTDLAVFRDAAGLWAAKGVTQFNFGRSGDIPFPRDYDGDGSVDAAVYRPSRGLWVQRGISRFYFGGGDDLPLAEEFDGAAGVDVGIFRPVSGLWLVRGVTRYYLGELGDLPVPGNYDGTLSLPAVYRPAQGLWAVRGLTRFFLGTIGDQPVPADYLGDGTVLPGIFRGGSGLWFYGAGARVYWGKSGDEPVTK